MNIRVFLRHTLDALKVQVNIKLTALALALAFTFSPTFATAASVPIHMQTGGFAERPSIRVAHNPDKVFPLAYDKKNLYSANKVANHPSNLALMVIRDGKVLHESYNDSDENSLFFSMSMSKSLTAYSMAGLVCSGKVDINKPISEYTTELGGTYSTAKVRDALMMASGAKPPVFAGQPVKGAFKQITLHKRSTIDIYKNYTERATEPGTTFNYYAPDTIAVARVIAKASNEPNMMKEFKEQVWNQVGAESDSAMNVDKDNVIPANSSFSATLRDWGRIGLWSLAKNREDSCEGKWHKEANSKQITNHRKRQGNAFPGYGYQVWIKNDHQYWWVGFGGQRVGIDTKKNVVIVAFSHKENYMTDLYKLMDEL